MEKNLTTGSVFKTVVQFSFPYLLSYFLQTLYGMADLFIIGQFNGVDGTTAVSIGSQVMHMLTVMIVGLAMGATVMIGRAIGAQKQEQAARAIGNTVTLFMVVSILLTVGLLLVVEPITAVMSTPAEAVSGTVSYLMICFIGIPFITAYNIISSIFRGMGDSKSPMYFIAVACAANIALDFFFIGVCKLDAAGAALGTTLSQTISVIVSLAVITKKKTGILLTKKDFKPHMETMQGLLKIGVPVALQDGFIQIAFIVITVIANRRGLNDAAAVGIVEKIIGILFLVPSSMLSAVSALSAQNIGAGKHDRARLTLRYAAIMSVTWGIAAVLVMQLAAEPFISLFVDEAKTGSAEVIRLGGQYMRGYVWDCIFAGIHFSFSGYFCAYGLSVIPFIHNSVSILCARIPLSYFASRHFSSTLFPMGLASPAGSLVSVVICICVFIWMNKRQEERYMEKRELYQIGDVAKMFHLSVGSLRHYEKIGLVTPEYIDEETGYRYYSTRQFECLNTIRYLRVLDMPLPQIANFLKNRDIAKMQEMLLQQKEEVIRKQEELQNIEKKIDNRLRQLQAAVQAEKETIQMKKIGPRRIAWLRNHLSIHTYQEPDFETSIRRLEQEQQDAVVFLGKVGVGISMEQLAAGKYEQYDMVFLVLDHEDRYVGMSEELPEETCVTVCFCGSHKDAPSYYHRLAEFIEAHGLQIAGFSKEITMIDFGITADVSQFVTEIQIPVRSKNERPKAEHPHCR